MKIFAVTLIFAFNTYAQDLTNSINQIDSLLKNEKAILYARMENDKYLKVQNDKWPENIIESINIVKYESRVRLIRIYPFSQSGDWFYGTDSYFDKDGVLIGYVETKNHFNSICLEGAIHRMKIFLKKGKIFELVKSTILDSKGNDVSKLDCEDPYDFKPSVVYNLKNYLTKIDLAK